MKMTRGATDITGEDFEASLASGYKTYAQDTGPFVRFLPHIEQRNPMLKGLPQAQSNYRDYDDTSTVNLS